ncbi:MAG: methyl-accepting chemotaxis protein [Treponema sp.]|nr:methyl-accepting chemotaxis protein [Treponema sp.]
MASEVMGSISKQNNSWKDKSGVLARRIMILLLSLTLAIAIVFTAVSLINLSRTAKQNMVSTAELTMKTLSVSIKESILPAIDLINSAAVVISQIDDFDQLYRLTNEMAKTVPNVHEIFYGTIESRFAGGRFMASTGFDYYASNPAWDQLLRPWFIAGRDNPGTLQIINPYVDTQTFRVAVAMSRTIHDSNGRILGVGGTNIFLDDLIEIVGNQKVTSDGTTFIVSKEGLYLIHENTDLILNQNFFEAEGATLDSSFLSGLQVKIEGNTYWATIPVSDTNWHIVSIGSTDEMNESFMRVLRITIILGVVTALTAIFISLRFSTILTRPVRRMVAAMKDIAHGEGDLTRQIDISSKDELGDLAYYFNLTLRKIKEFVVNINKEAAMLSGIGSDLAVKMNETAVSMNEIAANIQNMKERVITQSATVTETSATMGQVVNNINNLNGHVENQSSNISQASSAIEEMVANIQSVTDTLVKNEGNVKTLMDASEVGRTGLSEVASDIQEIAKESEGLLEINSVMENIASQTNLLSMNAAIEAAHAGEAGKGFAVVADEIRKLAESSSEQSNTIGSVLKKIKSSIDKITIATDKVLARFEAIDTSVKTVAEQEGRIRNAMEEQGIGSRQILEGVSSVNEITSMVKNDSNEMLTGSKEVLKESQELEMITQEIASGINEMTTGAQQVNSAINQINEISGKNRDGIEFLIREVSKFKVE